MIIMIKLSHLFNEEESEAAKQAHKLGLVAGGWGTWKDKSGKTVAMTKDNQLVKTDPVEIDSEKTEDDPTPNVSVSDALAQQEFSEDNLRKWVEAVEQELGLSMFTVDISHYDKSLSLGNIGLPREKRGQGIGGKAMEKLINYADTHSKPITLMAAPMDVPPEKGDPLEYLMKFYRRYGFQNMKGKNMHMVRMPQPKNS